MSAWADQVETEEATNGTLANISDFPTLGEAAKPQPKAKAKARGVKLGFQEFLAMPTGGRADFADKSLQEKQIVMSLPTAPRGGPREEGDGRQGGGLGGGFRDYGGERGGQRFQREDRPPREEREVSRADTVDDWGSMRKFVPGGDGGGGSRGFGGGGFADRGGDRPPREQRAPSAADGVDDWGSSRKYEPSAAPGPRSGFDDRRGQERRFEGAPPSSKADTEDSWGRGRDFKPAEQSTQSRGFSGSRDGPREEREDRWARRGPDASTSAGPDGPTERPRLKLAPRSVPAGGEQAGTGADDRKPASNPFGAARPREEVLKEKGVDPIKEALKLEHGEVIRDQTPAEKELLAELEALTKQLEELKAAGEEDEAKDKEEAVSELTQQLDAKERALLKLQAEEDDRVRFARGGTGGGGGGTGGGTGGGGGGGRSAPAEGSKERAPRREDGGQGQGQAAAPRKDRW